MFIRLLTILILIAQPLSLAANAVDSDCGPAVASMAMATQSGCCCGDMAASCAISEAMSCNCFEDSNQNTPTPAIPVNQTSQMIMPAAIMPTVMIIPSASASHPAMPGRSIGFFRSNTHKQATLCVWLS